MRICMDNSKLKQQIRKGDPFAHMSSTQNKNTTNAELDNSLHYKMNLRIRELRNSMGWSQSELGKQLAHIMGNAHSIPTSTIASWEHKNVSLAKIPSPDKISALAQLFHVSIDYLKGFSDSPTKTAIEYISNQSKIENIKILPQELAQHMGEPIWISCNEYNGWMLLTEYYEFVDSKGITHSIPEICKLNPIFSAFPPCHVYFKQIYNRYVIPETKIRTYKDRMWVCINSPDKSMQNFNGWYVRSSDGIGVKGKTFLSFDSYFELWLAYTTPLSE